MNKQEIDIFLAQLKKQGKSSPAGMYWHNFYELLKTYKQHCDTYPPKPLILAASGESNAIKHDRLRNQLEWALEHDCLYEAIAYLNEQSSEKWNIGDEDTWYESNF